MHNRVFCCSEKKRTLHNNNNNNNTAYNTNIVFSDGFRGIRLPIIEQHVILCMRI